MSIRFLACCAAVADVLLTAPRAPAAPVAASNTAAVAFAPALGRYDYQIRWQHLNAGTAQITLDRDGAGYRINARANNDPLVRQLLDANYRGMARIAPGLQPLEAFEQRLINGRQIVQHSLFSASGSVVDVVRIKSRAGRDPRRRDIHLEDLGGAVDPFTAILRARAIPWQVGRTAAFVLLIGEDRYHLTLTCTGASRLELNKVKRPAWRLQPTLRKLDENKAGGVDADDRKERKETAQALSSARIYLAADASRDILRIVSDTSLGAFDIILSSHRPPAAAKKP